MLSSAAAQTPPGLLPLTQHHATRASTIPDSGDLNPYAIVVAPVSAGTIHQNDVLIDNFNNLSNLQGTGTTIVAMDPQSHEVRLFSNLADHEKDCPGGIGLTAAMTMLKTGYVIVGSLPSVNGKADTKGDGCLIVVDPNGKYVTSWTGPNINGPWGDMALRENADGTASLFVSMTGYDVPKLEDIDPATGHPRAVQKAKVVRFDLAEPAGAPPSITAQTVVADGFGERADRSVFIIGPTGVALDDKDTLYVSDAQNNRIASIPNAVKRGDSAGLGDDVTTGELLQRPLALALTPQHHLLAVNAVNGQVVEIDLDAKKQLYAQWIDADAAQQPPGNGDLFGIALRPDGKGFYYVEDDMNTLVEAGE